MALRQALERSAISRRLFNPGERGLIAFSGGIDSLALAILLLELRQAWALRLTAVHVDHGLRAASSQEATRARALGQSLGLEVELVTLELAAASGGAGNVQQRAREARYDALAAAARRWEAHWVAVAHTATDQAELVLMRALRGSGSAGLAGMRWTRPLQPGGARLIRPLLDLERPQLEQLVRSRGLQPVDDPTNHTGAYLRNRLRQRVLPLLEDENPRAVQALCRLAATCGEESQALDQLARRTWSSARRGSDLLLDELAQYPAGLRARIFRLQHEAVTGGLRRVQRSHLRALEALATGQYRGRQEVHLPRARVVRRYQRLCWLPHGEPPLAAVGFEPVRIDGLGPVHLSDGRQLLLERAQGSGAAPAQLLGLGPDAWPLWARPPVAGDRVALGSGRRKVSRVLMDAKVPREARGAAVVLTSAGQIVMVVGHRRAQGWGPGEGRETIHVSILNG